MQNKNIDIEIWKPVIGFEGIYEVSSHGRVRSLDRIVECKNGVLKTKKGLILSLKLEKSGYLAVNLKYGGNGVMKRVHCLVAQSFIPNPENKEMVNHKNGIKSINYPYNLEWNSGIENNHHARRTGLIKNTASGSKNTKSKAVVQLDLSGNYIAEFGGIREAARNTTANNTMIMFCCKGKYSQSGGFKWMYKSDYESIKNAS